MLVSRSRFRTGIVLIALSCLSMVPGSPASAQTDTKSSPSPVAPGDLSKPVFDTTTPVYDSVLSRDKASGTIVAEVEGRAITLGDVSDAIQALPPAMAALPFEVLYPGILEQLIKEQALVIRAQQSGADEDPVIRRRVRAASDHTLANQYLHRELAKGITEAALLERYNRDLAGKPGVEEVRARIIMVPAEKQAMDLIGEIRGGADFADVARRASKDPSARNGGDLGFNGQDQLNPRLGAVMFSLPAGQLAPFPVNTLDAWYLVRVEERRRRPTPGFAAVRDELVGALLREGAVPLTTSVLNEMKVRVYNIMGKEADKENGGTR